MCLVKFPFTFDNFFKLFCNILILGAVNAFVMNILSDMQLTGLDMMNNQVKTAKYKLSQHKVEGSNSSLTIFQVAKLMDTIKRGEDTNSSPQASIYFSAN